MANFTKKAIESAFLKLIDERPLSKITVKDIVAECGINRNSFYYHFADMPSLIEEIVMDEVNRTISENPSIDSMEESFHLAMSFVLENKRAVYHIYNSVSRDIFERYLMRVCGFVASTYVKSALAHTDIQESDKELLALYVKCGCFGAVIDWLQCNMEYDMEASFKRLLELKKGTLQMVIEKSKRG